MSFLDISLGVLAVAAIIAALAAWKNGLLHRQHALSFRTLGEIAPAGIWRADARGRCTYVNKAFTEMTGLRDGEWLGDGWARAVHPDDRESSFRSWKQAVANKENFRAEWRWLRPDGSSMWVATLGAPELDRKGEIVAYVGVNLDIHRAKELQAELIQARARAEDTTAAKTNFLANMSHEIRTPMNGVIGFTDLLMTTDLTPEQERSVRMIADSGRAMMQLLNDILDLTKIESGQMEMHVEPTDLRQKIRHCVRMVEPLARQKDLTVEFAVSDDLPESIETDRLRLRQVLMNLLGNAVKFTERGHVLLEASMETRGTTRCVVLRVSDTGIGIDRSKIETIFDPFTQEDGSVTRRYGGTGLGLSISNQLVQKMGGSIEVESTRGHGTCFTVRFPLKVATAHEPLATVVVEDTGWSALKGTYVLVAEDHGINQQLIMSMVEALGMDARLVEDGEQAVRAVEEASARGRPFEVVLMDVQMPRMDGLEATRRLRKSGISGSELPIVALTANCYADDIAACRSAGMQAHIGKPLNCASLARELIRVLDLDDQNDPAGMLKLASKSLVEKYSSKRDALLDRLKASIEQNGADQDWDRIRRELHDLAGVAANFGEAELGEISRQLERRMKLVADEEELHQVLREAWPQFEAAA